MIAVIIAAMWIIGLILFALVGILLAQILAARMPTRAKAPPAAATGEPTYIVLMPAHDEAAIIEETVAATRAHLAPQGGLLVIADNCTDDTAARARNSGALVVERFEQRQRGKGHALAYGIAALRSNPPRVVLVLDADCRARPGAIALLATEADRQQRPVQGMYSMVPSSSDLQQRFAAFAWHFRTGLRAEGYRRLGLPCQLMGSGMAIPWLKLDEVSFETGHIVEDLKLGLDFAKRRAAPLFLPQAVIESPFPGSEQGARSQRRRWEHGHLAMIAKVPGLLWKSLCQINGPLLAMTIDMCVPPLALLAILLSANVALAGLLVWLGVLPITVAMLALWSAGLFAAVVLLGWWLVGRRWLSATELLAAPYYILRKLPLYLSFFTRRETGWIKTQRG
jgi:cellulose synthase/poly-beta-1,6-N-acetylglucosamine synthase-like glycosyltransferase